MRPAARMLQAVARASDPACASIAATVVPLLLDQYTLQRQVGGGVFTTYMVVCDGGTMSPCIVDAATSRE